MKSSNLLKALEALAEGNNQILIISAQDLKDYGDSQFERFKVEIEKSISNIQEPKTPLEVPETESQPSYLTAAEVCEKLRISNTTLWRMATKSKTLLPIMVNGQRRYSLDQVKQVMHED